MIAKMIAQQGIVRESHKTKIAKMIARQGIVRESHKTKTLITQLK